MTQAPPLAIGLLGAGRIGLTHAQAAAALEGVRVIAVHDPSPEAAEAAARLTGASARELDAILDDPAIDAVLICTPTDLHADHVERAAAAGKAIFCEKPIDLDLTRARACIAKVKAAGVPFMLGFNRRYDPGFAALKAEIDAGVIGRPELVQITSRDPAPPPIDYLKRSGGLFRDMMIHDFDMARFLLGEEMEVLSATGAALTGPDIAAAGDIDTAIVTLRAAGGALVVITNSRRASYGYDQRVEVHGSAGMLSAANRPAHTVTLADASGFRGAPLQSFFMDRYAAAYRNEIAAFARLVLTGEGAPPDGSAGLAALALAEAANGCLLGKGGS